VTPAFRSTQPLRSCSNSLQPRCRFRCWSTHPALPSRRGICS